MLIPTPTPDHAKQFALMLHIGLPPSQAILYFLDEEMANDPEIALGAMKKWLASQSIQKELEKLMGGKWESLPLDQRIGKALDKHYAEKAYYLYSHNYTELTGIELSKAQEARKVLEAKLAGTSGKLDPLAQFWDDLKANKVKLGGEGKEKEPPLPELVN